MHSIVTMCFFTVSRYSPTPCTSSRRVTITCHISFLPCAPHTHNTPHCCFVPCFGFTFCTSLAVGSPYSVLLYHCTLCYCYVFCHYIFWAAASLFIQTSQPSLGYFLPQVRVPHSDALLADLFPYSFCFHVTFARALLQTPALRFLGAPGHVSGCHTRVKADASGLIASIFEPIIGVLVSCITITSCKVPLCKVFPASAFLRQRGMEVAFHGVILMTCPLMPCPHHSTHQ